jgi:predicted AAA+ superfamily ATPase
MNKDRLKEILLDQKEAFNRQKQLIARDVSLETAIGSGQVIIISGVRRCGKSSLLFLIKEKMKLKEQDYCYFNFDDERIIADIALMDAVYTLHIELYGKEPVLFLDEVQNIPGWEKFVNRVHEKKIKVFVTGSNAHLLSSEIATSITGRNKIIELFPFSFAEYLRFIGHQYKVDQLSSKQKALLLRDFGQYTQTGGFPLVVKENDLELINTYFRDILYRDIIARYRLSQVNEIKQIGLFLASNCGKRFSYATLQQISGVKSLSSIKDYLGYYEHAYLFFFLMKFDYSLKKQVMNPRKVYAVDPAFSQRLGFNFSENKGRMLENIVLLELLRKGKEVYYHDGKNECDFIVKEGLNASEAIQVCWSLDNNNLQRELDGLIEAMTNFQIQKGTLLVHTIETDVVFDNPKINIIPVWKWILAEFKN